jgi:hypothetical protein
MDEHGWEFETLILDGWQKMTKYGVVIHYQEVWMSKVWCLVFFSTFRCYLFVCRLVFVHQWSGGSVLVLVVERVFLLHKGDCLYGDVNHIFGCWLVLWFWGEQKDGVKGNI